MLTGIFSTGVLSLLASAMNIGAYVGLSGWLPLKAQIAECRNPEDLAGLCRTTLGLADTDAPTIEENQRSTLATPVFLAHTTDDEVIDVELGRQARDILLEKGLDVVWCEENTGGHLAMLKTAGLDRIVAFLDQIIR